MEIKLFGGSTVTGCYLKKNYKEYLKNFELKSFSRSNLDDIYFDLNCSKYPKEILIKRDTIIISLAPIWEMVPFLKKYFKKVNLIKIKGIVIVSSTSTITKKYSWNKFDKDLYTKLSFWEEELIKLSKLYNLQITLIRPSLIYGDIGYEEDKNISFLLKILKKFLILPLPAETGIRQPIHYSQLVKCIFKIANSYLAKSSNKKKNFITLNLGGDDQLTFEKILISIKKSSSKKIKPTKCFFLKIPNRLFFLLVAPIILISPKYYAAILRISINMGGFMPAYKFLGEKKKKFPIKIR